MEVQCGDKVSYVIHGRYMELLNIEKYLKDMEGNEIVPQKLYLSYLEQVLEEVVEYFPPSKENGTDDYTVYTGTCGVFLLFQRLEKIKNRISNKYLDYVDQYLQCSLHGVAKHKSDRITYYCGPPGVYSNAVLHYSKSDEYLTKLLSTLPTAISQFDSNEPLYGRAGYLASLIHVWRKFPQKVTSKMLTDVANAILKAGRLLGGKGDFANCPLMWEWHKKKYWGAAHGAVGILFLLLEIYDEVIKPMGSKATNEIQDTIDFLLTYYWKEPSGNFPSRKGGSTELVQWCHGATGFVLLMCKAYDIYKEEKYLNAAMKAESVIWNKGFLLKGPGLCHGVSGNAYTFLALYKRTKSKNYLMKACAFVSRYFEIMNNKDDSPFNTPDSPYSLYEGVSGMGCLLIDLINIENEQTGFPAYEDL